MGRHQEAVQAILARAATLPTAEMAALLERECGSDVELRAEVESLVVSLAEAGRFLGSPTHAGVDATVLAPLREKPGTLIGRYKLLQQIGEGGFGSVFMAEQREPVQRKVALKIIKLGMDTRQVIARFEAERQALAMMDHPAIAKVFDAGATETGRPYFVMELVTGEPITEYCDKNNLAIPERLELFTQICRAVQHAHQKGLIHRDLKPSNILVSTQDGRPAAKVIDFGIAKATAARLTEKTLFTEHKALIGTPEYMSPEQAEGSLDIDTRADVYALGVLLYELLTGSTPFDAKELREAAFGELQRIIREVEPPKPSTRLSTLGDALASIAAHRHTEPARLGRILLRDLDWIVMKALEKDRARRYETANALALDVQRYVAGEPVVAAPPGTTYRLKKFVRRHRAPVLGAAAVLLALVAGLAGTMWQAHEAGIERDAARLAEKEQRRLAESESAARKEADKSRARAEAIHEFVTKSLQSSDPHAGGKQDTLVADAMMNAIKELDAGAFKDDPKTEADLRETIGDILQHNGRAAKAEPLFVQVLATDRRYLNGDHTAIARSLRRLAAVRKDLGRAAEAEPLCVEALEMNQRLFTGDHPEVASNLILLAQIRQALGRAAEAEPLYLQALEMNQRLFAGDHRDVAASLNNLAAVREALGRATEAEPLIVQALEMNQRLFKGDHPDVATCLNNLAAVRKALGRVPESEPLYVQALEMCQRLFKGDHPNVAVGLNNLGHVRQALGRATEAEPLIVQALEMNQRLFKGDHPEVARSLNNVAYARQQLGRMAEAEPLFVQSLEMYQRLLKGDHPSVAWTLINLGSVRQDLGRAAEAEVLYLQALEMYQRLFNGDHPEVAACLRSVAGARMLLGRASEAEPFSAQALEMNQRLYKGDHVRVAESLSMLARARDALGKTTEARRLFDDAVAMLRRLSPPAPSAQGSPLLARVLWRSACARLDEVPPDAAGALPELEEAVAMAERFLPPEHPHLTEYRATLAKCREALGK